MYQWLSCSYITFRQIYNPIKDNPFLSYITVIFFRTLNCHYNVTDLLVHHFVVSYEVGGYETCIETQFLPTINFSWLLNSVNITLLSVIDCWEDIRKRIETSKKRIELIKLFITLKGRLCGLVVRVPGYIFRSPGSIPSSIRFSEK
jgi:hypothetical protein